MVVAGEIENVDFMCFPQYRIAANVPVCQADCCSPEAQLAAATAGVAVGLGVGLRVDNYHYIYRYLQISIYLSRQIFTASTWV